MIWYPYQQMKTMQTPYEIVDAEGVYLYTRERRMIDSVSSWWSVIHGYKHPALNQVLVDQAGLDERMKHFVPKKKEVSGYLKRYAALVSGGAYGAILNG